MADSRPIAILMVEDDPGDAHLISTLLLREGRGRYHLEHRARLAHGLEVLGEGGVDVVLLDFSLPDSSGVDSFRTVHERHPEVPVVILTSLDDDFLAACAVEEGAQDYLVKSQVDTRLLSRAIRYAIARNRSERALRDSEERYAVAAEGANDGLWDWDVKTGALYLSPRWQAKLGLAAAFGGRFEDWTSLVAPHDRPHFQAALDAHLRSDESHVVVEHRMTRADGNAIWVLTRGVAIRDAGGRATRLAGSHSDITENKLAEQRLLHDAFHDGLTGLANRTLFLDRLSVAIGTRREAEDSFALFFLDLDRFKTVNDSLGHAAGDEVLVRVARRLEAQVRPGDAVARLGGDEFAILVGTVRDAAAAVHVAERLQAALAEPFEVAGNEVSVTGSIGIVMGDSAAAEGADAAGMLRDADLAMYRAKAAGCGRYEVYDIELHRAAMRLLKLEIELRHAVAARDFVMHYQPIVTLDTGRIVGFEALTRWNHPQRGLIPPMSFIGVAEETGLIIPLGWFVLESACRQARAWHEKFPSEPPLFMSVNVSGKLFAEPGAVGHLLGILEATGLPAESLRLEVTESVVLEHSAEVMKQLLALRAWGVKLSIDDFGTGYSSLSYLQRFRYDSLKIDKSFVGDMESTDDARTIVETIVSLASHLGIGVVAEGVETAEQLKRLRSMGCPHGQGYWFARPLDVPAAEELIASRSVW